jgi:hypothetical protein
MDRQLTRRRKIKTGKYFYILLKIPADKQMIILAGKIQQVCIIAQKQKPLSYFRHIFMVLFG